MGLIIIATTFVYSLLISKLLNILYWIKWCLAYVAIRMPSATHEKRFNLYNPSVKGDPEKCGFLVPQMEIDLESPQSELHMKESADEIVFYGVNSKAECLLVRIARGTNEEAEAWIYLKMADGTRYHLTEQVHYQQPFEGKCTIFSCGNLQMHYMLPMRRWRIQYCGPLTKKYEDTEMPEESVFVKFVFLWKAASDVYDSMLDINSQGLAEAIARSEWNSYLNPSVNRILEGLNFYSQMGNIRGTVSINEDSDVVLNFFGEKVRNLGNSSCIVGGSFETLLGYVPLNGFGFHLVKTSVSNFFKNMPVGFAIKPDGDMHSVRELDIRKSSNTENKEKAFSASFTTASGISYELTGSISLEPIILNRGEERDEFSELSFVTFTVGNKTGFGLFLSGKIKDKPKTTSVPVMRMLYPKNVPLTVKFSDEISHFGDISGGKGSSLGKLTKLSLQAKTFSVPKGIIVTTAAYEDFMTDDILNAVKRLENIVYGNVEGDVRNACEEVAKNILKTVISDKSSHSIIENLKSVFGDDYNNRKFAVRSSATGEDTDTMSAAGQMETFLGVQGQQEVLFAVKKCWASQFGHIAVEYKRQNGQILNSPMAVVIQEMVDCEVSGVMFTCDPVNNNPSVITITANYGLGETVVSGSVEPDTIVLTRSTNEELQVKSINVGSKHQRIVLKDICGTITEDLPEDLKTVSCIKEETALNLGKLGMKVEKFYKSPRDIEWGILNNEIYLLQSRPVTSSTTPSEFELRHEFDSYLRCEREYFTAANVGEVFPGAVSPLGMDIITKFIQLAVLKYAYDKGQFDIFAKSNYYPSVIKIFYHHVLMSAPELLCRYGHDTIFSKGYSVSFFGRIIDDPEILEISKERIPDFPISVLWSSIRFLKDLFMYNTKAKKCKKLVNNYDFKFLKCRTSNETFNALMESCADFHETGIHHLNCTNFSSHFNILIFSILVNAKGQFDTDVYSDFGRLLFTSLKVESADVPSSVKKVANQIIKDVSAEKFQAMSLDEAEKWLNTSKTLSSQMYQEFLTRHGHRCLQEWDVYKTPWGQDQKLFIKLLQTLTGSSSDTSKKSDESYSDLFSKLSVPLSFFDRLKIKCVLPFCRNGVKARETSKSMMIKSVANWRKGYQHLSKLMVAEGRIPDKDLLYFMTFEEIRTLLKTRYPKIISRAILRKKAFPVWDQIKFPEITRGFPKPINEESENTNDTNEYKADLTMHGIPVSQGVAKGYARVATSLAEAEHLKPGEILIAYSTDIGWSPYFPIISGVVTELGGLISHGAVVSREYGLPCVVGLRTATKEFNTGDYVLLDGKKGVLQRLPKP